MNSSTRRVHLIRVTLTPAAIEMHRMLAAYVARLWELAHATGRHDVQLAAMVLSKRAFSSAGSLASSLDRRLAAMSGSLPIAPQPALTFDTDSDPADEAPPPVATIANWAGDEEGALRQVLDAAKRAQRDEDKVRVLRKLFQRVREPIIVFTEYRDTLNGLELAFADLRKTAVLHGGQAPQERRDAIEAFTAGRADLLLATDAGAEGLNLQNRCRLVVNLELPWNPIRLEQRIGRVDRIGQSRTVHAINLVADGTAESTVLAALFRRLERIQASEIEMAACIINRGSLPIRNAEAAVDGCTESVDLKTRARAEAARLRAVRSTLQVQSPLPEGILPVARIRSLDLRSLDHQLQASAIFFVRVRIANGAGRLVEDALLPLAVPASADYGPAKAGHDAQSGRLKRRDVRSRAERLIDRVGPAAIALATRLAHDRARSIDAESAEWVRRAVHREDLLSREGGEEMTPLVQAGLFDNRALANRQSSWQRHRRMADQCGQRSALLEAGATAFLAHDPYIALVLVTC